MPRKGTVLSPEAAQRQKDAIRAWQKENTTALSIRVRNENAEKYLELLRRRGCSLSGMVIAFLDAECEKEGL